jgi:hypothetical protein
MTHEQHTALRILHERMRPEGNRRQKRAETAHGPEQEALAKGQPSVRHAKIPRNTEV